MNINSKSLQTYIVVTVMFIDLSTWSAQNIKVCFMLIIKVTKFKMSGSIQIMLSWLHSDF